MSQEEKATAAVPPDPSVRRPWHAPRLEIVDVKTHTASGILGGNDANTGSHDPS